MDDLLFWVFAITSSVYVVHLGLYLVAANLYDMLQARRIHLHYKRHGAPQAQHRGPLLSVIISAFNEEKVIVRCLDSILQSSYLRIQVVAVDDGSTDQTHAILRNYRRKHKKFNLQVVRMTSNQGKGKALNHALRRFTKGEFVMTLDADSVLDRHAIRHALAYFTDPAVAGVAANVRIMDEPGTLPLLQKLEHMIGYRSKKLYSLANCEFVVGGVASTYRMDILRRVGFYETNTVTEDIGLSLKIASMGNRTHRLVYGSDVTAMTEGVSTLQALIKQRYRWKYGSLQNIVKYRRLIGRLSDKYTLTLTWYRLPMALVSELGLLAAPLIWAYVLYVAVVGRYFWLILGAYMTITAYTLVTVWFDEHTSISRRIRLSLYAPLAYFLFYIMDVVQFVAVSRCLLRAHHLINQKDVGSAWVSPSRIGREVANAQA